MREDMHPEVSRRECGGWLATSPAGADVRIGVVAASEGEAIERFKASMGKWLDAIDRAAEDEARLREELMQ